MAAIKGSGVYQGALPKGAEDTGARTSADRKMGAPLPFQPANTNPERGPSLGSNHQVTARPVVPKSVEMGELINGRQAEILDEFFTVLSEHIPEARAFIADLPIDISRLERASRIREWMQNNKHLLSEGAPLFISYEGLKGIPPEIVHLLPRMSSEYQIYVTQRCVMTGSIEAMRKIYQAQKDVPVGQVVLAVSFFEAVRIGKIDLMEELSALPEFESLPTELPLPDPKDWFAAALSLCITEKKQAQINFLRTLPHFRKLDIGALAHCLKLAAKCGNATMIGELKQLHPQSETLSQENFENAFLEAIKNNDKNAIRMLMAWPQSKRLERRDISTILHDACLTGNAATIAGLRYWPDLFFTNPFSFKLGLTFASRHGHANAIAALREWPESAGVSVDAFEVARSYATERGHQAALDALSQWPQAKASA